AMAWASSLPNHDLDAAVQGLLFGGAGGGDDGTGLAHADDLDVRNVDAELLHEPAAHGFGALETEVEVELVAAEAVGVAFDDEGGVGIGLDDEGELHHAEAGFLLQFVFVVAEEDV